MVFVIVKCSAERNNQIFGLFVCNGDIRMLYEQWNIRFSF